ncbi:MAG: response regulator [Candidatus Eremiobacteraeota bacterium]|nr:response regulator [Candidatus Eremiobacteraeota bacterium]
MTENKKRTNRKAIIEEYALLREIAGSALFFSNIPEYSTLVEEKLKILSGWDMVRIIEHSISRGCFISRDIRAPFMENRNMDFFSPNSPVIQEVKSSENIVTIKLDAAEIKSRYEKKLIKNGFKYAYLTPIGVRNKFVGVLAAFSKNEEPADDIDLSLLSLTSEILALSQEMYFNSKKLCDFEKVVDNYENARIELESAKILEELSSGIVFKSNNLLAGILGYIDLFEKNTGDMDSQSLFKQIKRASVSISETVATLQELRKLGARQDPCPLDINRLIKRVIELTKPKWKDESWARNIEYKLEVDLRPLHFISGNSSRLMEALIIILFQAIESIPRGGRIIIESQGNEDEVVLSFHAIQESGLQSGLTIFDPFLQDRAGPKIGPDIEVARKIMKRHNGQLLVESKIGRGNIITIKLPVTKDEILIKEYSEGTLKETGTLLVVEDEQIVRELLRDKLKSEGFKVTVAENGQEALNYLREKEFDLLLTDLGMPGMSGNQLSVEAKELWPDMPIILATGWESRIDRNKLKEYKIDYVVGKPFQFNEIINVILESLIKRRELKKNDRKID